MRMRNGEIYVWYHGLKGLFEWTRWKITRRHVWIDLGVIVIGWIR